ncbi:hypothetical protein MRX96_002256 [Rhipicephalus microplus]
MNPTTFTDKEADESSVAISQFNDGGFPDSFDSIGGAAGDGQQSSSIAFSDAVEDHHFSPEKAVAASAAMKAATSPDEPIDFSMRDPSMSSEVQHGQWWWRILRPPKHVHSVRTRKQAIDYAYNPHEARRRKEQARTATAIVGKEGITFERPGVGSSEHVCIPGSEYPGIPAPTAIYSVTSCTATPAQATSNWCYLSQH